MVHTLTIGPFSENTYLLSDDQGLAVVIDPGMSNPAENAEFDRYIERNKLSLRECWLTHAHIDHVLGLAHVFEQYGLQPRVHPGERPVYEANPQVAMMYGLPLQPLPLPIYDLEDHAILALGEQSWKQILAPGHSPASIAFYNEQSAELIGGDVLFRDSIGRTDLPGGNHEQLLHSIQSRIYTLAPETKVYPGHGPTTTLRYERVNNPFVRA